MSKGFSSAGARAARVCVFLWAWTVPLGLSGAQTAGDRTTTPFTIEPGQLADVQRRGVEVSRETATDPLRIEFSTAHRYPNVLFSPAGVAPWDWGKFGAIVLRVRNPMAEPTEFSVRVDDDPETRGGTVHCQTGSATVPAGAAGTFVMEFPTGGHPMKLHGMRGGPPAVPLTGAARLAGSGSVEPGHVTSFQIFMDRPGTARTLIVEGIRLVPAPPAAAAYDGIVDRFGQYTRADWAGKIHNDAELNVATAEEAKDLSANPVLPDRDRFGGWGAGPAFPPTGFFATRKVDGQWWLVDPDGRLFFSAGIDAVTFRDSGTVVTGREAMFTDLPAAEGDPLAQFYRPLGRIHSGPISSGRTYNFYAANLFRKFGADIGRGWERETVARFRSWGFNTLGNWSDERLEQSHRIPYTASLGISGNHRRISDGEDYWGLMHDPFDPAFTNDVRRSFARIDRNVKDDPWCVGYFVDNELSWGGGPGPDGGSSGIAYGVLREAADSPAKQALLAQLKAKYGDAGSLAKAWGQDVRNWEALARPYRPTGGEPTSAMKQDMSSFVAAFASKYFAVVRDALRESDPNHLYLGCRFAYFTDEEAKAAADACDVVSFNVYEPELEPQRWAFATRLGKPCLIGEFHVGATDRGMFHPGLVAASDQQGRARIFTRFVESVADHPAFVGCHWFEYIDEPLTGRAFDGENYNIGFVTVADTPYPEMVAAARASWHEIYARRAKGGRR